jgi:glutathione S-transferase
MLTLWADEVLFLPSSGYAIRDPRNFPPGFYDDRAAMRGQATITSDSARSAAGHNLEQLQIHLRYIEETLSDDRPFILGRSPSLADFAAYARLWWAQLFGGDQGELEGLKRVETWKRRVAAIGHGTRTEITPKDALAVAASAEPEVPSRSVGHGRVRVGMRVSMATERFGPDPVDGEVVAITDDSIALLRDDAQVGRVNVHLPRQGYEIHLRE